MAVDRIVRRGDLFSADRPPHAHVRAETFGWAVARADDVNGDGYEDFLVGAPEESLQEDAAASAGKVYLFSGRNGVAPRVLHAENAGDRLGNSVAGAGDVNRDGVPDFLIGIPYADAGGGSSGRARVYSGADGAVLLQVDGTTAGAQLGWCVGSMGDLDGDGIPDFAAGAPNELMPEGRGTVRTYSGADGSTLYRLAGGEGSSDSGWSVAGLLDIDGDGAGEIAVGDPCRRRPRRCPRECERNARRTLGSRRSNPARGAQPRYRFDGQLCRSNGRRRRRRA